MKDRALEYGRHDLRVIPLEPGGKKALIRDWPNRASSDPAQIRRWWERWPDANIGLLCGQEVAPGRYLAGIDVDFRLADFILQERREFVRVRTRRGAHLYSTVTQPIPSLHLLPSVTLQGQRAYLVAPPSRVYGTVYEWEGDWTELPTHPPEVVRQWAFVVAAIAWLEREGSLPVQAGERNVRLTQLAGFLQGKGDDDLLSTLSLLNEGGVCTEPLPDSEIETIAKSIGARPADRRPEVADSLFVTVRDFLQQADPNITWLWEPFIGEGLITLLAAAPKVGKSTLSTHLLRNLIEQLDFLGRPTRMPPRVYFATEERLSLAKRLSDMGLRDDPRLLVSTRVVTWSEIIDTLEQAPPGALIILDTGSRFWPVEDENDAAMVNMAMLPLMTLAQRRRLAVVFVHHLGKGARGPMRDAQVLNFVRGSSALLGAVDIGIALLAVNRHPNRRRIVMLGRFGSDEIVAELTENGYQVVDGEGQHSGETGIAQAVSFLKAALSNGPVRATEMEKRATEAGISLTTLNRAKKTLNVRSAQRRDGWYWELL